MAFSSLWEHLPPAVLTSQQPSTPVSFCAGHLLTPLSRRCRHPSHASVSPANLSAQRLCRQSISENCPWAQAWTLRQLTPSRIRSLILSPPFHTSATTASKGYILQAVQTAIVSFVKSFTCAIQWRASLSWASAGEADNITTCFHTKYHSHVASRASLIPWLSSNGHQLQALGTR